MKFVFVLFLLGLISAATSQEDYESLWVWDDDAENGKQSTEPPSLVTSRPGTSIIKGQSDILESTTENVESTPKTCSLCSITPEYNPVCGTDKITYNNPGILQCAKICGADVELLFHGTCKPL